MSNTNSSVSSAAQVPLSLAPMTAMAARQEFALHRRLSIRQKKRWWEILTNFDTKNSYAVFDEEGNHTLQVKEEGSGVVSVIKRLLLRQMRPFKSVVYDNPIPKPILHLQRPFRFIFHELNVAAPDGTPMGTVVRRWTWFRRRYEVLDAQGAVVAELFGPIFSPWTFHVRVNGNEVGSIRKKWSGGMKEIFTDADNFAVTFDSINDPALKALVFAATVLIDVVHFEYGNSGGGFRISLGE
jgi:uncharacterized protein YxjI